MANDKNNNKELVTEDDDPTAELEAMALPPPLLEIESEAAASTAGYVHPSVDAEREITISELKSDLRSRSETINRLQFDIETLRSRRLGLEAEIQAREEITQAQNREMDGLKRELKRKVDLVKKRDGKIKALKAEIRERNDAFLALRDEFESLERRVRDSDSDDPQDLEQVLAAQAGRLSSYQVEIRNLQDRIVKSEQYADQLRQQLLDREEASSDDEHSAEFLERALHDANHRIDSLLAVIADAESSNDKLTADIAALHTTHADEIRMIRFELGEAQETISQHALINEQLASDLVETRSYRVELEGMLTQSAESNKSRIEKLELENEDLRKEARELQDKLENRSEAINCLLSELAKKTQQIESIGEIEGVIHDIDGRMSERIDEQSRIERDRITRVLIGTVDGQELRFPLFKDRLTIGRTKQNDILLNASYISRRHAVIVTEGDATRVIDWGSKNGVFVNARRITEHFLKNGDVVTIGTAEFRYEERPKREA